MTEYLQCSQHSRTIEKVNSSQAGQELTSRNPAAMRPDLPTAYWAGLAAKTPANLLRACPSPLISLLGALADGVKGRYSAGRL